eukprot:c18532_g1_i1 orf=237-923(+)
MHVNLEFSNRRLLLVPQTQVQPCTHLCSLQTQKGTKSITCAYRKGLFGSMACSSHVNENIFTNKHSEKDAGILIVDHGSRRPQSNAMIHTFVDMFKQKTGHVNVEPAHMELASPTIKEAFDKCVRQGANRVIITPYFLSPGRHWDKDIPALAAEAAKGHENVSYIVTAPIGLHALMVDILQDRITYCLSQAAGKVSECDMCAGTGRCKISQSLAFAEIEEFAQLGKES